MKAFTQDNRETKANAHIKVDGREREWRGRLISSLDELSPFSFYQMCWEEEEDRKSAGMAGWMNRCIPTESSERDESLETDFACVSFLFVIANNARQMIGFYYYYYVFLLLSGRK